jgi:hypothetical protein
VKSNAEQMDSCLSQWSHHNVERNDAHASEDVAEVADCMQSMTVCFQHFVMAALNELISVRIQVPDCISIDNLNASELRERLAQLDEERSAIIVLLRAALAKERKGRKLRATKAKPETAKKIDQSESSP